MKWRDHDAIVSLVTQATMAPFDSGDGDAYVVAIQSTRAAVSRSSMPEPDVNRAESWRLLAEAHALWDADIEAICMVDDTRTALSEA
ncbi:hypothetical protein [Burkholderia ubonensis]|uniref:hypothetical protein n=1 Tax=Burkholderia ubonensis TaxID=101571 RepID=UPI000B25A0C6|nr:hypothetical protein [Burkholderia ubonensis]